MSLLIIPELVALTVLLLFPGWAARGLSVAILRLSECSRWWTATVLGSAIAATWCVIYQDARRLDYARHLARLWSEWFGH